MGKGTVALTSFNAGELSPDIAGRIDNDKYPQGASLMQNFIPMVQGPGKRRPGFNYVANTANSANKSLVRRFVFSQGQAYALEWGNYTLRFYVNHGYLTCGTPAAWSNSVTYTPGQLVSYGGGYWSALYQANLVNLNYTPGVGFGAFAVFIFWHYIGPASSTLPYEIWSPYSSANLFNSDGTPGIQTEQSGDVLYVAGTLPNAVTLTRVGATQWALAPFFPTDGPFLTQNAQTGPCLYATLSAGVWTLNSTAPVFDPSDVFQNIFNGTNDVTFIGGRLIRLNAEWINLPQWTPSSAVTGGAYFRYNGNTYQALNTGQTGSTPPTQTYGVQWDGPPLTGSGPSIQWLYIDSGYCIFQVTGYTSSTQVTVVPSLLTAGAGPAQSFTPPAFLTASTAAITAISKASQAVVTTALSAKLGDFIYITGVAGMTQINGQGACVTAVGTGTLTLAINSSNYSAYTSGGTAIYGGTTQWSFGAWGGVNNPYQPGIIPTCLSFYAERLFLAGYINWWGSVPELYNSFTQDLYGQVTADCAVDGIIAAQDVDAITWLNATLFLMIGTSGGEFALSALDASLPLGPGNTDVERQSKMRSRAVRSELIGTSNYYVQKSGKKVLAQDYTFFLNRYESTNQNRLANHIAGYTVAQGIVDIAYHAEPYESLWCVTAQGTLIGFLIDKQDQVTGWHEHVIGGTAAGLALVESICVIPAPDGVRDELWMVVNRTINGGTVRSVEYMAKDLETGDAQSSAFYVDMGATYTGAPVSQITGLTWLIGETVQIFQDGGNGGTAVVNGSGVITLPNGASTVNPCTITVGLACPAFLNPMRLEVQGQGGTTQGKIKRVPGVTIRVKNTLGGYIGMASGPYPKQYPLMDMKTSTLMGTAPAMFTGDIPRRDIGADNESDAILSITQPDPFPMEIVALFPYVNVTEPYPQ